MIKLAYCNVWDLDLEKAYPLVPPDRQEKIDYYRFNKDKRLSAGVYLLLKKMLDEVDIRDFKIKIDKYNKPYISNYNNIYFNLSHSENMILCAISDMEVGADIEYNDATIDLNIAKHYFFNKEYESIINSDNPSDEFFKYWVLKESYMKYTGLGMKLKLDSFEISIENEDIKLKNDTKDLTFNLFDIKDYKAGIASHYEVSDLIEYSVEELY